MGMNRFHDGYSLSGSTISKLEIIAWNSTAHQLHDDLELPRRGIRKMKFLRRIKLERVKMSLYFFILDLCKTPSFYWSILFVGFFRPIPPSPTSLPLPPTPHPPSPNFFLSLFSLFQPHVLMSSWVFRVSAWEVLGSLPSTREQMEIFHRL